MATLNLKTRLLNYLKGMYPAYVASGTLQKLTMEKARQTPRTAVRRLQELQEEGLIEVDYRAKNHAWYRYAQVPLPAKPKANETVEELAARSVAWFDALPDKPKK